MLGTCRQLSMHHTLSTYPKFSNFSFINELIDDDSSCKMQNKTILIKQFCSLNTNFRSSRLGLIKPRKLVHTERHK